MSALPNAGRATGASTPRVHRFDEPGEHSVRFCGPVESIHVHWPNKPRARAIACSGTGCTPEVHKMRLAWQGYLAAEVWRIQTQKWEPVVAQITPGWFDLLKGTNPRGSMWLATRCKNEYGKDEIVAHLVAHLDPQTMRCDIDVKSTVCRCYGVGAIAWNRPPILTQRQFLMPSLGDPPPTAAPPVPLDQVEGTKEYEARLKADQDKIRKAGGFLKFMKKKQEGGGQ